MARVCMVVRVGIFAYVLEAVLAVLAASVCLLLPPVQCRIVELPPVPLLLPLLPLLLLRRPRPLSRLPRPL